MNGYIVLKPAAFNGKQYNAGEIIPAEEVIPARIPALKRTGIIADAEIGQPQNTPEIAAEATNEVERVTIPLQTENGVVELSASDKDIVTAIEVLQLKADDIPQAISAINSEAALIIIDACTKNQAVKKAVRARAEELAEKPEETNDEEE